MRTAAFSLPSLQRRPQAHRRGRDADDDGEQAFEVVLEVGPGERVDVAGKGAVRLLPVAGGKMLAQRRENDILVS